MSVRRTLFTVRHAASVDQFFDRFKAYAPPPTRQIIRIGLIHVDIPHVLPDTVAVPQETDVSNSKL